MTFSLIPPKILLHPNAPFGGGHYRIIWPASVLRARGYATTKVEMPLLNEDGISLLAPDVVVRHSNPTTTEADVLRTYRRAAKPFLVYEIDDALWATPDSSPHKAAMPRDVRERIKAAASVCDVITATVEPLAIAMRKLTGREARIIPNMIPAGFARGAAAGRKTFKRTSSLPRVGWAGGIGHADDLAVIRDVVQQTLGEFQWVFFGMCPEGMESLVEFHHSVQLPQYAHTIGSLGLDLALAPLTASVFNQCKSNLRVLEYGAAGYPVLASRGPTYEGCPVEFVKNTTEDWLSAIRALVADEARRDELAQRLHDWVSSTCLLNHDANLLAWERAWLPSDADPFVPGNRADDFDHPVATIGRSLPGLPHVKAFGEANASAIACIGEHTVVSAEQVDGAVSRLHSSRSMGFRAASVSAVNNDGIFPAPGQFTALETENAEKFAVAVGMPDAPVIQHGHPNSVFSVLSGHAMRMIGLPDEHRYQLRAFAMMEWGARALEYEMTHLLDGGTFTPALAPSEHTDQQAVSRHFQHVLGWYPNFGRQLQNIQRRDELPRLLAALDVTYHGCTYDAPPAKSYAEWAFMNGRLDLSASERESAVRDVLAPLPGSPKISIIMTVYNPAPEHLHAAISSVLAQVYENWQLVIVDDGSTEPRVPAVIDKIIEETNGQESRIIVRRREENGHVCRAANEGLTLVTGDWVMTLDHDDTLAPQALMQLAIAIVANPTIKMAYSDYDHISPLGEVVAPYFKPDFNYELLLGHNFLCHFNAYRTEAVRALGGWRIGYEGSQDYDLSLRYIEAECWDNQRPVPSMIHHIPDVLYHWRQSPNSMSANAAAKPYAIAAARKAVLDHLTRTKQPAAVGVHPVTTSFQSVRFLPPENTSVAIIIPTQASALICRCLFSILKNTNYPNYKVIVVNTGPDNLAIPAPLRSDPRISVVRVEGPFNWSLVNNWAADRCKETVLCFLNDDTEVVEAAWLHDMVGCAMRPGIGAVGARLTYPANNGIQHGGIFYDPTAPRGLRLLHAWQRMAVNDPGPFGRAVLTAEYAAVTGACMVIGADLFRAVGGFDAEKFPLDYGDVDLCFRLQRAGYRNIVAAHAMLVHHEGATKRAASAVDRTMMLAAEDRLIHAYGMGVKDVNRNPNLHFGPHLNRVEALPARQQWQSPIQLPRTLIVNGSSADLHLCLRIGRVALACELDGLFLRFTAPVMGNFPPIDLRQPVSDLAQALAHLSVDQVILRSLGHGTPEALGFLAALHRFGAQEVSYQPTTKEAVCPRIDCTNSDGPCGDTWRQGAEACQQCVDRDGSAYGHTCVAAYRLTWGFFLDTVVGKAAIDANAA